MPVDLFDSLVPRDDVPGPFNGKRGIRQEIEDVRLALLKVTDPHIRTPLLDGLADLVGQFGELRTGVPRLSGYKSPRRR